MPKLEIIMLKTCISASTVSLSKKKKIRKNLFKDEVL